MAPSSAHAQRGARGDARQEPRRARPRLRARSRAVGDSGGARGGGVGRRSSFGSGRGCGGGGAGRGRAARSDGAASRHAAEALAEERHVAQRGLEAEVASARTARAPCRRGAGNGRRTTRRRRRRARQGAGSGGSLLYAALGLQAKVSRALLVGGSRPRLAPPPRAAQGRPRRRRRRALDYAEAEGVPPPAPRLGRARRAGGRNARIGGLPVWMAGAADGAPPPSTIAVAGVGAARRGAHPLAVLFGPAELALPPPRAQAPRGGAVRHRLLAAQADDGARRARDLRGVEAVGGVGGAYAEASYLEAMRLAPLDGGLVVGGRRRVAEGGTLAAADEPRAGVRPHAVGRGGLRCGLANLVTLLSR